MSSFLRNPLRSVDSFLRHPLLTLIDALLTFVDALLRGFLTFGALYRVSYRWCLESAGHQGNFT